MLILFIYQNYCRNIKRYAGTIGPFRWVFSFISSVSNEMHLYRICREYAGTIGTVECEFNQALVRSTYAEKSLQENQRTG